MTPRESDRYEELSKEVAFSALDGLLVQRGVATSGTDRLFVATYIAAALRQAADEALERAAQAFAESPTTQHSGAAVASILRYLKKSPATAPAAEPSESVAPADLTDARRRYAALAAHPLDPLVRVIVEPCEAGGHYRNENGVTFHPSKCRAALVDGGEGK